LGAEAFITQTRPYGRRGFLRRENARAAALFSRLLRMRMRPVRAIARENPRTAPDVALRRAFSSDLLKNI